MMIRLNLLFLLFLGLVFSSGRYAIADERTYISNDALQCETLRFICPEQQQPFFDAQGCGCEAAQTVLKSAPPYYSTDVQGCATLEFQCREGFYPFFDQQGCGCQRINMTDCEGMTTGVLATRAVNSGYLLETALKPRRRYLLNDINACQTTNFKCEKGYYPFFDAQGCGCQTVPTCPKK
ncbi:hypothetical protein BegalDRAFT_1712 [Beggiatoa alba B18LD]|uniref:Uncharacterized protein n=1 Tax=Beggiatoa alba B18LD TaxID=395493 RepID=I3CG47_9GAMM|nr:hypothetical protein [Beggiatoa alba]EIJ42590.1 hypothetical protein BegalDRAFT_1712 [Beggiatoa alba B18LD]